jgi:hypothetical protein
MTTEDITIITILGPCQPRDVGQHTEMQSEARQRSEDDN